MGTAILRKLVMMSDPTIIDRLVFTISNDAYVAIVSRCAISYVFYARRSESVARRVAQELDSSSDVSHYV